VLLDTVIKRKKQVILQFFIPGHGKTRLDGTVFGRPGVGGAVEELLKKERLRTTEQLKRFCEIRKLEHQSRKTVEANRLQPWLHLHWIPTSFPLELNHMHQKAIQSLFCWESQLMVGYQGLRPVTMWCHGLAYKHGTKIQMRIVTFEPQLPGEYTVAKRKAGYPKDARVGWNLAPVDVSDTPSCNLQTLAAQAQLLSQLEQESGPLQPNINSLTLPQSEKKQKRKLSATDTKCTVKKEFAATDMALSVSDVFWNGKYKILEAQCKAHGVSQSGKMADMIKHLREHYKLAHVDATFKARTIPLSAWLKHRDVNG
jgi:hypothetical protein